MPPPDDPELLAAALAAAGQLRECVAAVHNLEHLVTSISVGPQVLTQVIPDVAHHLRSFEATLDSGLGLVTNFGIEMSGQDRALVCAPAQQNVGELLELLGQMSDESVTAKRRLGLERSLGKILPVLVTTVAHVELLLEACQAGSAEMTVLELLTSLPERGSDRPHRPVSVGGSGLERLVCVPPRVILKALSAWSANALAHGGPNGGLLVGGGPLEVEFSVAEIERPQLVARFPVFSPASYTEIVVGAVLRPLGGSIRQHALGFGVVHE